MKAMSEKPRLLVATNNKGKVRELKALLSHLKLEILTLKDLEALWRKETLNGKAPTDDSEEIASRYQALEKLMEETADTFSGNALLKARGASQYTGLPVLADDSGLEVEALGGAPGVYSARYAGNQGDDQANNDKLIGALKWIPENQRQARYVAVLTLALPDGRDWSALGKCEGKIVLMPEGEGGFGYDPYFYLPQYRCTMAQLDPKDKNKISHRGQAIREMLPIIENIYKSPTM